MIFMQKCIIEFGGFLDQLQANKHEEKNYEIKYNFICEFSFFLIVRELFGTT